MAVQNNKSLLKMEIDNSILDYETTEDSLEFSEIEFEIETPVDITDPRQVKIYQEIADIDQRLEAIEARVGELNADIDKLTNHADGLDYTIAVASGILCGLIDSFFVGEFNLERGREWGSDKIDSFVKKVAENQGYTGDNPIAFLEKQHPAASDKAMGAFGGSKQHHLRDFAHHPTLIGLIFSMLTQFTECAYGTDVNGIFKVEPIVFKPESKKCLYIGDTLPKKIMFGCVHWFFHLISDMGGSNSTPGAGTGIPGPILSLAKELSVLPIFKDIKIHNTELTVWISKLFNGTLLANRDENGKIAKGPDGKPEILRFDLRAEIGVGYELGRQAIPVLINECIVRVFYFIRRLYAEFKASNIKSVSDFKNINWKKTLPFKNRTIVRMMTIATGTFTAVDLADAAIRSVAKNGFTPAALGSFVLRINFVGVGRFAIAVVTDVGMDISKHKKENEKIRLTAEQLKLLGIKLSYLEEDMWISADDATFQIEKAYESMKKAIIAFENSSKTNHENLERIKKNSKDIKRNNPSLLEEIKKLDKWG